MKFYTKEWYELMKHLFYTSMTNSTVMRMDTRST